MYIYAQASAASEGLVFRLIFNFFVLRVCSGKTDFCVFYRPLEVVFLPILGFFKNCFLVALHRPQINFF